MVYWTNFFTVMKTWICCLVTGRVQEIGEPWQIWSSVVSCNLACHVKISDNQVLQTNMCFFKLDLDNIFHCDCSLSPDMLLSNSLGNGPCLGCPKQPQKKVQLLHPLLKETVALPPNFLSAKEQPKAQQFGVVLTHPLYP